MMSVPWSLLDNNGNLSLLHSNLIGDKLCHWLSHESLSLGCEECVLSVCFLHAVCGYVGCMLTACYMLNLCLLSFSYLVI